MRLDPTDSSFQDASFAERHAVETPEQTSIEFTVAGVGSRFLALAIDTLIQAGILLVIGMAFFLSALMAKLASFASAWILAILVTCVFLLFYGYFLFFEIYWNGQTPGKRRIGLRVIKDSGRRLSAIESIARNLLRIVDQVPGFYAVGILVAMLNSQNKRLGDFVAGSIVVREASLAQIKETWKDSASPALVQAPLGAERLSEDELILIESFLQRRHELALHIRSRMAREIFRRVEHKLNGAGSDNRREIETLLETAVHERRSGM